MSNTKSGSLLDSRFVFICFLLAIFVLPAAVLWTVGEVFFDSRAGIGIGVGITILLWTMLNGSDDAPGPP